MWSFAVSAGRYSGEPWLLAHLVNERPRHSHPDAGMLTMAAPSGTDGIPAAVTDGGGAANVRRARSAAMRGVGNLGVHSLRHAEPDDLMFLLRACRCRSGDVIEAAVRRD
jgi:hypothetical protein